jgi:hypothetical protein
MKHTTTFTLKDQSLNAKYYAFDTMTVEPVEPKDSFVSRLSHFMIAAMQLLIDSNLINDRTR